MAVAHHPECTHVSHEAVKSSAQWASLEYVGVQPDTDDDGNDATLELRNCSCGSTLAKQVSAFPIGASTIALIESMPRERCFCCAIPCVPADDEGRCATCVERDAWPCTTCGVHTYADERHAGELCEDCAASARKGAA